MHWLSWACPLSISTINMYTYIHVCKWIYYHWVREERIDLSALHKLHAMYTYIHVCKWMYFVYIHTCMQMDLLSLSSWRADWSMRSSQTPCYVYIYTCMQMDVLCIHTYMYANGFTIIEFVKSGVINPLFTNSMLCIHTYMYANGCTLYTYIHVCKWIYYLYMYTCVCRWICLSRACPLSISTTGRPTQTIWDPSLKTARRPSGMYACVHTHTYTHICMCVLHVCTYNI